MSDRDSASLLDIAVAARRIESFIGDLDQQAFLDDEEKQSAVLYQFVVIGEATKRLSREFRTAHSEVPWRRVAGMRARVTHGYDAVDIELVWRVASEEVPDLLDQIRPFLSGEPSQAVPSNTRPTS